MTIRITDPAALIAWCIANKRCVVCGDRLVKTKKRCCDACGLHWRYCPDCKLPQPWSAYSSPREAVCAPCKAKRDGSTRIGAHKQGWQPGQPWRVSRKADRERENIQIDRWRAIDLPWDEIARRLDKKANTLQKRYWYWRRRSQQAQPAGQRGPSDDRAV